MSSYAESAPRVVIEAATALGTMANVPSIDLAEAAAQPSHECLRTVKALLDRQRLEPGATIGEPLGYIWDRIGGGISLETGWNMLKAWIWLLLHRQDILDRFGKEPDAALGPLMPTVMKSIKSECEPLFREFPDDRPGSTGEGAGKSGGKQWGHPYRPREGESCRSTRKGKGKGGDPPLKWVMLRYPWPAPTPEESTILRHGLVPGKTITDWVKGMLRRTFGKRTLAKTLLQNGCSKEVLAEYKRQNDQEHATQALLATMWGPSLADRRFNLQRHA